MIEQFLTRILLLFIAVCFGLILGNFCTTLFYRLPRGLPINGRNLAPLCSYCGHSLRFYEYLPVLSWISTLGRCRYCKCKITFFYTFLELTLAIVAVKLYIIWGIGEIFFLLNFIFASIILNLTFAFKQYYIFLPISANNISEESGAVGFMSSINSPHSHGGKFEEMPIIYILLSFFTLVICAIFATLLHFSTLTWLLRLLVVAMFYLGWSSLMLQGNLTDYLREKRMKYVLFTAKDTYNLEITCKFFKLAWVKRSLRVVLSFMRNLEGIRRKIMGKFWVFSENVWLFMLKYFALSGRWHFFIFILAPACLLLHWSEFGSFLLTVAFSSLIFKAMLYKLGRFNLTTENNSENNSEEFAKYRNNGASFVSKPYSEIAKESIKFYGININIYSLNLMLLIIYIYKQYAS